MDSKTVVYMDFDGVIANSVKSFIKVYNSIYNENVDWRTVDKWNFSCVCPSLKEGQVAEIFASQEFFDDLELYDEDTYKVFHEVAKKNTVYITTKGTPENIYRKTKWIHENLNYGNMILLSEEEVMLDKSVVNMEGGVIVDDNENNLFSSNATVKVSFGKRAEWNENWYGITILDWHSLGKFLI